MQPALLHVKFKSKDNFFLAISESVLVAIFISSFKVAKRFRTWTEKTSIHLCFSDSVNTNVRRRKKSIQFRLSYVMPVVRWIRFYFIEITQRVAEWKRKNFSKNETECYARFPQDFFSRQRHFHQNTFQSNSRERKTNIGFHILIAWEIVNLSFRTQLARSLVVWKPGNLDEKCLMKGRKKEEETAGGKDSLPVTASLEHFTLSLSSSLPLPLLLHIFCFRNFPQARGFVIAFPWYNW